MSLVLHEALSRDVYKTKLDLARELRWFTETGQPDTRRVEKSIERARKAGQLPIMSGSLGYRLARNADEYEFDVQRRRKRALVQLASGRGEIALLRKWRGEPEPPPPPPPRKKHEDAAPEPLWGGL